MDIFSADAQCLKRRTRGVKCGEASPKHLEAASWRHLYQIASQSFHQGVLKCSEASEADANCSFFVFFVFLF